MVSGRMARPAPSWRTSLSAFSAPRSLIPRSMAHLQTEMVMKNLLKEIYKINYMDVRSMKVDEKTTSPQDITGNLSESGRVIVTLVMDSDEVKVFNWFVKIMPKQHKNSELMNKFNIFENEISFYKEVAPDLLNFLGENGAEGVQFDIPKLLFAENGEDGAVIILEDVSEQGFTQDRDAQGRRYLSEDKARLAMDAVAKIHAASKLFNLHKEEKLEEKHLTLQHNAMWEDREFLDRLSAMKDTYCEVLRRSPLVSPQDSGDLLERFERSFDAEGTLEGLCAERVAPKHTGAVYLQHGDFHFNNLLFKEEGGVMKVMIVDWQLVYTGRSTGDVSYLLLSSIHPDLRQTSEQQLKQAYFDSFNSYLKEFESCVSEHQSQSAALETEVEVAVEDMESDYEGSAPLSLFLSCGNVMVSEVDRQATPDVPEEEWEEASICFAYSLLKEAASRALI